MKYLLFEQYKKKQKRKLNKKKIIFMSSILLLVILVIAVITIYTKNEAFRNFFDQYILRKDIHENDNPTIEVSIDNPGHIYAYDRYITILDKSMLKVYSSSGRKEYEIEVNINTPTFDSNNRFLLLAEENGKKIYLISGQNILWQKDLEGEITRIHVNKNGYVSVVISGTSYKNIVITFNPEGRELFKTYLSNTIAADIQISNDNKYLGLAEIDTNRNLNPIKYKNYIY